MYYDIVKITTAGDSYKSSVRSGRRLGMMMWCDNINTLCEIPCCLYYGTSTRGSVDDEGVLNPVDLPTWLETLRW